MVGFFIFALVALGLEVLAFGLRDHMKLFLLVRRWPTRAEVADFVEDRARRRAGAVAAPIRRNVDDVVFMRAVVARVGAGMVTAAIVLAAVVTRPDIGGGDAETAFGAPPAAARPDVVIVERAVRDVGAPTGRANPLPPAAPAVADARTGGTVVATSARPEVPAVDLTTSPGALPATGRQPGAAPRLSSPASPPQPESSPPPLEPTPRLSSPASPPQPESSPPPLEPTPEPPSSSDDGDAPNAEPPARSADPAPEPQQSEPIADEEIAGQPVLLGVSGEPGGATIEVTAGPVSAEVPTPTGL